MRAITTALLLVTALAASALAQTRDWHQVRDPGGLYVADLPGKPDAHSEVTDSGPGSGHNVELDDGAAYFEVLWSPLAASQRSQEPAAFLKIHIESFVTAAGGTVLSQAPLALDGAIGADVLIDFPADGARVRQRLFVLDGRIVTQTWSGKPGGETSPEVERFFASLRLRP